MSNGNKLPAKGTMIPGNPGPYFALPGVEDDRTMKRAMKGATTSRAAGMANQAAEKAMRKRKKVSKKR